MPRRRLRVAALLLASASGGLAFVLPVTPAFAGTQTTTNACKSNATATYSDIDITMVGTAAPNPVTLGGTTTLSGASFQASVPATLLIAGYNLGLLTVGVNDIPVNWWVARQATNTVEGTNNQNGSIGVSTTIGDPDGAPGTGDETATPLNVSVPLADWTVTPTGGNVELRQGGTIPQIPAGQAGAGAVSPAGSVFFSASVAGGLIRANFDCSPGLTDEDGPDNVLGNADDATTFTSTAPAVAFETVTAEFATGAVAPRCNDEDVSVTIEQTVSIDLSDNCTDANGVLDLTTLEATDPDGGTLTPDSPGTFSYEAPSEPGEHSFTFTIADVGDELVDPPVSNTARVTITVNPPAVPVCTDETVTVEPGADVVIDLSDNCTDADGDIDLSTLEITAGAAPVPGDAPGTFNYTAPAPGTEVFTFTVADERGLVSEPATLTIVSAVAPPPPAPSSSTTTTTAPVSEVPVPVTGTASYPTTCKNSVTPDVSELLFEITGTTLSPVTAGSAVNLTNQSWKVAVPASVLQTGMNLGLLKAGDTVSGAVTGKVFASNTVEGALAAAPESISVGPIAVDGAGKALPVVVTFAVADMTWTSVGADVAFTMAGASVAVSLGPLTVTFTCEPKAPVATIVTAAVRGVTNLKAAPPPSGVLAADVPTESLARTGWSPFRYVFAGIAIVDLGYLLLSSTRSRRRWRRAAPRPT